MSLIKFDNRRFPWFTENISPWLDTQDLFSDDFFVKRRNAAAVNIKENEEGFLVEIAVPGFSKNEIEITIEDGYLKIVAEKSNKEEEKEENYTRREFSFSNFNRNFKLPVNIDDEKKVKANYENGILKLNLSKKEAPTEKPKKVIEIA